MSKEFKGTKGEWSVMHDTASIECNNEIILLGGYLRNHDDTQLSGESWLSMRERTAKGRQDIKDERLANAKIAAASKELLKALQSAYRCSGERNMLTKPVLDEMLEAINKALN